MGGIAMKNRSIKEMKRKLKIFYKKFPNKEVINLYDAKNYLIQLLCINNESLPDEAVYSFLKENGYKNIEMHNSNSNIEDLSNLEVTLDLDLHTIDDSTANINSNLKHSRKRFANNKSNLKEYLETNNPVILEELLINNKKLVKKYANIYKKLISSTSTLDLCDIEQVGMIGLHRAIQKFDPDKLCEFSSYAVWWIKYSIIREIISKANTIKIPVYKCEQIMKIRKLENESMKKYGYIDKNLICTKMNIDNDKYDFLKMLDLKFNQIKSLDSFVDDEQNDSLIYFITISNAINSNVSLDFLEPDKIIDKKLFRQDMLHSLEILTEKEKNVILLRFGFINDKIYTLQEIGHILNLSKERVRRIEIAALKKLFDSNYVQTIHEQYTIA